MRREPVIATLHGLEALRRFTGGHDDQRRLKARTQKRIVSRLGVFASDVDVSDDGAAVAEFETRTFRAQLAKQAGADLDVVTAIAERNFDRAHVAKHKDSCDAVKGLE